ncbi:dihydrolipoamide acetyltransferase family protein [Paraliomyxa miuraensis]|uniref:dihydrolipoamide acetyltransferase family protein n=1 Tax=Paraliomyxa miuraensis TaxID=376150 RepID=UPI00225A0B67|nr:dihydrolipoamide acetyltransferase family protein [Paraliomyxa miuraensis]MCX4246469.1 2-oxo acid dehydrogenase subunit E2 [Paraliomyxa miuraensis]
MPELKLPAIGEGVVEVEIVRWLKKPGDRVAANEGIVEVMTDKATMEIPSPVDAVIERILIEEGAVAEVGQVIAIFGEAPADPAPTPAAATLPPATTAPPPAAAAPVPMAPAAPGTAPRDATTGKVLATPAARALAREHGIDLDMVPGRDGRITKSEVMGLFSGGDPLEASPAAPSQTPTMVIAPASIVAAPAAPATAAAPVPAPAPAPALRRSLGETPPDELIPFRGMRRRIAEGMSKSFFTAVHYTYVEQVDVSALVKVREQARKAAEQEGVKLSYLPFIVKAVILGLKKYPIVNAVLDEEGGNIIVKKRYGIGIATATDQGLMVPVVHDADRLSLLDIGREIARVSEAARSFKASREELTGSTFTITSLGTIGGVLATPILNYPEVGILGVHAIRKTPVVDDNDQIVVGHLMNLSVSLDHRVVDGFEGASFLQEVKRYLEDPTLLLLAGI